MAGLLTISGDQLKYDEKKSDALKDNYDALDKQQSKRIRTYDQEMGYAMHPEERAGAMLYKDAVNNAANTTQTALDRYKGEYATAMANADQNASGILAQAQREVENVAAARVETVPIRVVDGSGTRIERTYHLPRAVADSLAQSEGLSTAWVDNDTAFNVSVRVDGGRFRGEEIHTALANAERELAIQNEAIDAAQEAADIQYSATEAGIRSSREIAEQAYNQEVSQTEQQIEAIRGKWTTYLSDQQAAFQEGIRTNAGGIRDLIDSGALTVRGSVKNG